MLISSWGGVTGLSDGISGVILIYWQFHEYLIIYEGFLKSLLLDPISNLSPFLEHFSYISGYVLSNNHEIRTLYSYKSQPLEKSNSIGPNTAEIYPETYS